MEDQVAFTDVEKWGKLPWGCSNPEDDGSYRGRFIQYRAATPSGDFVACTLCGATVGHQGRSDLSKEPLVVAHWRWHLQLALVEDLAMEYLDGRAARQRERVKADTVALRVELEVDNRVDNPSALNTTNPRP